MEVVPIEPKVLKHKENHGAVGSSYVKSIVFGGLDGIITTFSIVAAVAGASLSPEIVIMMGFANLLSDGISMGLGDYLSESAEIQYIKDLENYYKSMGFISILNVPYNIENNRRYYGRGSDGNMMYIEL